MNTPVPGVHFCLSEAVKLIPGSAPDGPFPSVPAEWWGNHKPGSDSSSSSSTNATKIKERQGPPPGGHFPPPDAFAYASQW